MWSEITTPNFKKSVTIINKHDTRPFFKYNCYWNPIKILRAPSELKNAAETEPKESQ
jgi:hypothetical protein